MKKIFALAAMMTAAASTYAQKPDTLFNASGVQKIMIVDGADGVTVKTLGNDSTVTFEYHQTAGEGTKLKTYKWEQESLLPNIVEVPLSKKKKDHVPLEFTLGIGIGLNLGFSAALNAPAAMNTNTWSSGEVSWLDAISFKFSKPGWADSFQFGIGYSWRNFRMTDGNRFVHTDGVTSIAPFKDDVDSKYSRLQVHSLSLPVLWNHRFSKNNKLQLGGIVNFNAKEHHSLKARYTDGNRDVREKQKINSIRPVTIDAFAAFSIVKGVGLYVRYSPQSILKKDCGPEFQPLSFGVRLGM